MADNLITDCEGPENLSRSTGIVVLALFLLVVGGSALIDGLFPKQGASQIGGVRRRTDLIWSKESFANGDLARSIEFRLRKRSRVRQATVPYWSAFLLRFAGEGLKVLIVGRDNTLFIRRRVNIRRADTDFIVDLGALHVAAVERRLETLGTRIIAVPVPRKAAVAADDLPPGVDGLVEYDHALIARLQSDGIETVDLFEAWSDMPADRVFMRYDSHWNASGQLAAAKACAAAIGAHPSPALGLDHTGDRDEVAKSLQMIGIPPDSRAARMLERPTQAVYSLTPPERDAEVNDRSVWQDKVIVGSSFTYDREFATLVSYEVGEVVWEQGYPALPFMAHLNQFIRDLGDRPLPSLIWWEIPMHQVLISRSSFDGLTRGSVGKFWTRAPTTTGYHIDSTVRGRVTTKGDRFRIRKTRVATSGDGVLGLRLRGTDVAGTRWRYSSSRVIVDFVWPKSSPTELLIPVIHTTAKPSTFTVLCLSDKEVTSRVTLEIEVIGAPRTVVAGIVGEAQVGEEPSRESELPGELLRELLREPLAIVEHAALFLDASPTKRASGDIEVIATTTKGVERSWHFTTSPGGVIVLSLHPLAGATLDSIVVRTASDPGLIEGRPWRVLGPR